MAAIPTTEAELASLPPQHNVVVTTDRLMLRPCRAADIYALHKLRQNTEVMTYMRTGVDTEPDPFKSSSLPRMVMYFDPRLFTFAIEEKGKSEGGLDQSNAIGFIGMRRVPEVFYIIDSPYWGKGYMTEALRGFVSTYFSNFPQGLANTAEPGYLGHADGDEDLVFVLVLDGNTGSERVAVKAGFEKLENGEFDGAAQAAFVISRPGTQISRHRRDMIKEIFSTRTSQAHSGVKAQ